MKTNIKILFVTHLFHPAIGGVEIHIKHLSAGLVKRGYQVKVLTTNAYSTEAFFLGDKRRIQKPHDMIDGVEVERLGFTTFGSRVLHRLTVLACRIKYPFNHWIRFFAFGPRNRRKFTKKIILYKPDLIIASPLPTLNIYYASKASKILKKPLIIIPSYHIFDPCCFYNQLFFKMMRRANKVVTLSDTEKDFLVKEAEIDQEKVHTIAPFPITEQQLDIKIKNKEQIRNRYNIREKYVVLYLGQHGLHKKVHVVLEAMKYVWQYIDMKDVAFVVAGGTTGLTAKLKRKAHDLKNTNQGQVYFIDNFAADEKTDLFQMADIFISLSEMESFGIVFVEAMMNGLPMIASKNCVARNMVEEFKTGILVEPANFTEVAGSIIELLSSDKLRQDFSKNARKNAIERFHPNKILDAWEVIIGDVV